jgi:hypothetical protein
MIEHWQLVEIGEAEAALFAALAKIRPRERPAMIDQLVERLTRMRQEMLR